MYLKIFYSSYLAMSTMEEDDKETKKPDYDKDEDRLEEKQEQETGETTNQVL
jgi:hypothetical protein